MDETVEQYEKRVAEARLTFSRREEAARMHTSQIQTFASDAMKAPALVAAGGVAAALGFTAPTTLGSQASLGRCPAHRGFDRMLNAKRFSFSQHLALKYPRKGDSQIRGFDLHCTFPLPSEKPARTFGALSAPLPRSGRQARSLGIATGLGVGIGMAIAG